MDNEKEKISHNHKVFDCILYWPMFVKDNQKHI